MGGTVLATGIRRYSRITEKANRVSLNGKAGLNVNRNQNLVNTSQIRCVRHSETSDMGSGSIVGV